MEQVQRDIVAQPVQPLRRAVDLRHAGQESENAAIILGQRKADRTRHLILDPRFAAASDMAQVEAVAAAFALDHGGAHQRRKARTVQRRRHRHQPQVGPQSGLRIERQRQCEIAVEAAFVNLVEQHRRYPRQFGIGLNAIDENPLRQNGDARRRRPLAVHARGIAIGRADRFPRQFGHAFGSGARGEAAGGEQQDFAVAPRLAQQRGGNRGGLARAGRGDQHQVRSVAQRRDNVGKDRRYRQPNDWVSPGHSGWARRADTRRAPPCRSPPLRHAPGPARRRNRGR